ncbi:hypothetical protein HDV05_007730 [Chytridiales sp. JEL 0842]|nr:hypothetical protein HDV05_007730 [Chytridiales sp. JEL 0842]
MPEFLRKTNITSAAQIGKSWMQLEAEEKELEHLRGRCKEMEQGIKVAEEQAIYVMALEGQLIAVEEIKAKLQAEVQALQTSVLDTRRKFNIRKHYDSEIERWISSLKKEVETVEVTHESAYTEITRSKRYIKELEDEVARLQEEVENYKSLKAAMSADIPKGDVSIESLFSQPFMKMQSGLNVRPIYHHLYVRSVYYHLYA